MRKEDAKENGKRMRQEEIDKEIAELKEQLDALRRILEENERLGWVLRKKLVEWYKMQRRLQKMQVKWLKGKLKEVELEMEESICEPEHGEILGENEDEDLKIETSNKAKRSHGFKTDNLCMYLGEPCKEGQFANIVMKKKEDKQNLNYVLKQDEIDGSQMQWEDDIKQPSEGIEKSEKETIERFMSNKENLEHQEDMMAKASSETTRSYDFKTYSLCMMVGIAGEKQSFKYIFRGVEDLEIKGGKENFLEKGEI